jgi:hypothetical protein
MMISINVFNSDILIDLHQSVDFVHIDLHIVLVLVGLILGTDPNSPIVLDGLDIVNFHILLIVHHKLLLD